MKLSAEINELLIELVDLESIDSNQLFDSNVGMLCHNLLDLYGRTSNKKSHELIISIIDKSGYSLFGSRRQVSRRSDRYEGELSDATVASIDEFEMEEEEFMDLLPINGYFH